MSNAKMKRKTNIFAVIVAILIPLIVGGLSSWFTSADMNVYETLTRPPLAPPGWLFPIAWTILYVMMGVASYFVFISYADKGRKWKALLFYIAQLVMNFFWSIFFFSYSLYLFSFIWLITMWVLIFICIIRFYRIRRIAGVMMVPLFLWTTFAAYLNLCYFIMA